VETLIVPIFVALILGPITVLVQKSRKENKEDHANVLYMIKKIDKKLSKHINWHKETGSKE